MGTKVLFLTLNPPKPSTKQRVLDSIDYLRDSGFECTVKTVPYGLPGRLRMLASICRYDIVFLQKKLLGALETRILSASGARLVYDVDDAVMFHEFERNEPLTGKFFTRFIHTVNASDAVLVGNRFLYEFARGNNDNVILVPTPIKAEVYEPKDYAARGEKVTVGWMGTPGNLKYLDMAAPALKRLTLRYPDLEFKIISKAFRELDGVNVVKKEWFQEEEVEDLRSLDIGIMPLHDDIWAQGKSGNKILQYFAVAVPVVASPVGVNRDIIEPGVDGFLPASDEEWFDSLSSLVEDPALRMEMGLRGREKLMARYTQDIHRMTLERILREVAGKDRDG